MMLSSHPINIMLLTRAPRSLLGAWPFLGSMFVSMYVVHSQMFPNFSNSIYVNEALQFYEKIGKMESFHENFQARIAEIFWARPTTQKKKSLCS
jgi:hypothetical protein